jgi:non-heme Fe2+,alpha-ketoglutarate-dependent halogenase
MSALPGAPTSAATPKFLTPEQVRRYRNDGILFPVRIVPSSEMSRFQDGFRELERRRGGVQKYTPSPHLFFPWAWELVTMPRLLDAAQDLIGAELVIDSSLLLCKYRRDPAFAPWHQDGVYSGWFKTPSVSAWIAIVDATVENGCMKVIPGTHRQGRVEHTEAARENSLFGAGAEIEVEVDESKALCVVLAAGEASFHHSSIIHGSPPNQSDGKRISLIVRFVTPLFQRSNSSAPAVRARGSGCLSHMTLQEKPPSGNDDECFVRWEAFAADLERRIQMHRTVAR